MADHDVVTYWVKVYVQPDTTQVINLTLQTFKRHLKTFVFSTY